MTEPDSGSIVARFIDCLAALDVEGMASCLSTDVVLELPAAPPGMPRELVGLEAFRSFFGGVADLWDRFDLLEISIHPSRSDGGAVFVDYASEAGNDRGMSYSNTYLSKATVSGGRITRYREMFDAAPAADLVAMLAASTSARSDGSVVTGRSGSPA